jgi:hypothetical protein
MFRAVSMTGAEMRQGLLGRFTDGKRKFELLREGKRYRLNTVKEWGASLAEPEEIRYDKYLGIFVGIQKRVILTAFGTEKDTFISLVDDINEQYDIYKEMGIDLD